MPFTLTVNTKLLLADNGILYSTLLRHLFPCISVQSLGHLVWAGGLTVYMVIAVIFFEEPDLVRELGEDYKTYMKEVPRFVPNPFK